MMWDKIKDAVHAIATGAAKRVDGEGWSVYAVGNIIRVDIKQV